MSGVSKSRSADSLVGGPAADQAYVQKLLAALPPSRDLLKHYQEKLEQYEREEEQLLGRVQACAELLDGSRQLEQQLHRKEAEVERLREDLETVSIKLHEERRTSIRLGAEADQLRLAEQEAQNKVSLLLRLSGKTDEDVVAMLDRQGRRTGKENLKPREDRVGRARVGRSAGSLEQEVEHLTGQLQQQEAVHTAQLQQERDARRSEGRARQQDQQQLRKRIEDFQTSVTGLEREVGELTGQLAKQRSQFRKRENKWLRERDALCRKVEFAEKYGTVEGLHTEHRQAARMAGGRDKQSENKKMKQLEAELDQRDRQLQQSTQQILDLKNDLIDEKTRSEAAAAVLARKTAAMTETVAVVKERSEKLERRKALEIQGYQAELQILRDKLSSLETKLLAVQEVNNKDEENKEILEQLRRELRAAEKRKPKQWKD